MRPDKTYKMDRFIKTMLANTDRAQQPYVKGAFIEAQLRDESFKRESLRNKDAGGLENKSSGDRVRSAVASVDIE